MTRKDIIYYVLISLMWATTLNALKLGMNHGFSIFLFAGLRFFLGGIFLIPFIFFMKKNNGVPFFEKFRLEKGDGIKVVVLSFLMFSVPYSFLYVGLAYLPSGIAGIIGSSIPLFTMLFAHFFLHDEKFNWIKILGIFLGMGGLALLAVSANRSFSSDDWGKFITGFIFYTICAVSFGAANVAAKKMKIKSDSKVSTFYQTVIGGAAIIFLSFFLDKKNSVYPDFTAILSLLYVAIFGTAVSFVMYYPMINRLGATKMSTIPLNIPLIAVTVGYFLLGETISPIAILSALLIISGVALLLFYHPKKRLLSQG